MLGAFIDKLRARVDEEDDKLLLAATHVASMARKEHGDPLQPAMDNIDLVEQIDEIVRARLEDSSEREQRIWYPLYNHTWHAAAYAWETMADHVRDGWIGHHAQVCRGYPGVATCSRKWILNLP